QQRVLPDLRRDVDRAMERVGSFGHHALIEPPISVDAVRTRDMNPLIARRSEVLALRSLQSRLESQEVSVFVVDGSSRDAVEQMNRRSADLMHLSNVAESARRLDTAGYQSARKNLEALCERLLATQPRYATDSEEGLARDAFRRRY